MAAFGQGDDGRARSTAACLAGAMVLWGLSAPALPHGPLFSPAPETLWKGGTEITLGGHVDRASGAGESIREREAFIELEYGLTADWQLGAELPYVRKEQNGRDNEGRGDLTVGTKYQFFRRDLPGAQYKAATLLDLKLPSGEDDAEPRLGSGSTDVSAGLAWGYEGRRWYAFASGLYRINTEGSGKLKNGNRQLLNLVGGVRPWLSGYYEPDTVLMLELNWERGDRDELNSVELTDTGGWELFVSPVLWWTYRQFAFRGGLQIPVAEDLNGAQPASDYRARMEFVYHF